MPEIHARRRALAQQSVATLGADAALITFGVNVRYLTGLASSNAAVLLPADGPPVLATDSRYAGTAATICPDIETVIQRAVEPVLARLAAGRGIRSLAFEAHDMTVERHDDLTRLDERPRWLVPLGRVVEELRAVKDDDEVSLIERACAITGQAFDQVLALMRPGTKEREVAVAIERAMVDLGAEAPAFDTIVASGPNGAIPHHEPGEREFAHGDLVTIDCGARCGGYHADMTRTVAIGEPSDWQREIYELVARAQAAGVAAARPGAGLSDVDASARDMIENAGHGEHFGHGLGHGVGLEIHEAPTIGQDKPGTLADRAAITIEPGIYVPGAGGVRIEDTLVVRAGNGAAGPDGASPDGASPDGASRARSLTTVTRELLVL
jgi:Xaa-Pro aminopeptidase